MDDFVDGKTSAGVPAFDETFLGLYVLFVAGDPGLSFDAVSRGFGASRTDRRRFMARFSRLSASDHMAARSAAYALVSARSASGVYRRNGLQDITDRVLVRLASGGAR